jgi:hypothetical protein
MAHVRERDHRRERERDSAGADLPRDAHPRERERQADRRARQRLDDRAQPGSPARPLIQRVEHSRDHEARHETGGSRDRHGGVEDRRARGRPRDDVNENALQDSWDDAGREVDRDDQAGPRALPDRGTDLADRRNHAGPHRAEQRRRKCDHDERRGYVDALGIGLVEQAAHGPREQHDGGQRVESIAADQDRHSHGARYGEAAEAQRDDPDQRIRFPSAEAEHKSQGSARPQALPTHVRASTVCAPHHVKSLPPLRVGKLPGDPQTPEIGASRRHRGFCLRFVTCASEQSSRRRALT